MDKRETGHAHLILLFCGITATVLTAGAGAALFSRILYRRLKEKRRQGSLVLSPGLPLVDNLGGRAKDEWRSKKDGNMRRDMDLQDPFSDTFSGDEERHIGYAEVEREGLGVHFVDVDLSDDAGHGRKGKLRR